MKITIEGTEKEIATLVLEIQKQLSLKSDYVKLEGGAVINLQF